MQEDWMVVPFSFKKFVKTKINWQKIAMLVIEKSEKFKMPEAHWTC